ncbi:MAG TPA: Holliday junction resolvase RuvX [Candidatus Paceibacterota bacterium]|nr:Holliday junction resolvase RuvX [Candidatus Paceibacterota bacterium]
MRHLGIDFGTKKVGVAVSDEGGQMGFPHSTLKNDDQLLANIVSLIRANDVEAVVVGESRNLAGEENPVAKEAKVFAEKLQVETGLPVHFEPEVFTTQEAGRGFDGERGAMKDVDASAAALILTSYLTRHGNH